MSDEKEKKAEWIYRVWMVILTLVVVPTFVWVWNTDRSRVETNAASSAQLENIERRLEKTEAELETLNEISSNQAVMSRDIEYIRETVDDIKEGLR